MFKVTLPTFMFRAFSVTWFGARVMGSDSNGCGINKIVKFIHVLNPAHVKSLIIFYS